MTQSFDDLKKFAISDILSVSGKDKTTRVIENHMNNLIEAALIISAQSKQVEIDGLQKRIDAIVKSLENIKNDQLRSYREDYDKGWRDCAITVLNDLKGTINEQ